MTSPGESWGIFIGRSGFAVATCAAWPYGLAAPPLRRLTHSMGLLAKSARLLTRFAIEGGMSCCRKIIL